MRIHIVFPGRVNDSEQTLSFGANVSPNAIDFQWFQIDVAAALDADHVS
jgi:hypothetical protein